MLSKCWWLPGQERVAAGASEKRKYKPGSQFWIITSMSLINPMRVYQSQKMRKKNFLGWYFTGGNQLQQRFLFISKRRWWMAELGQYYKLLRLCFRVCGRMTLDCITRFQSLNQIQQQWMIMHFGWHRSTHPLRLALIYYYSYWIALFLVSPCSW